MTYTITLTDHELNLAEWVGMERQGWNERRGHVDAHGRGAQNGEAEHTAGAAAEMAVARYFSLYWEPLWDELDRSRADVGNLHVRSTDHQGGCLLLHPTDPNAPFVLVTRRSPEFTLVGWIRGDAGKRDVWWREDTGRPAFFVPQLALWDLGRVPVVVELGQ